MPQLKRIGIVGCGAIGGQLARSIASDFGDRAQLSALCDIDVLRAQALAAELNPKPQVLDLETIGDHCDLLIEAANQGICRALVPKTISMGRDIMVMSVGGLVDIYEDIFKVARARNANLYIPSGAIAGIDGLEAAKVGGIHLVRLTTRKPPASLAEAPFVLEKKIPLFDFKEETVVFEGSAREAIKAFPFNINVAATLSLAGLGFDRTRVRIITGPNISANIHEVEVEGAFGKMFTRTENQPSAQNPKTSYLAMLSGVAMLNEILNPVKIGV